MRYTAFSYEDLGVPYRNIGDEFQTLAALQFLPEVHTFIDRENLNAVTRVSTTGTPAAPTARPSSPT